MNQILSLPIKSFIQPSQSIVIMKNSSRRLASTTAHSHSSINSSNYFQKYWLSDPSTYPLMIIMGSALTFMTGAGIHALRDYKDVKLSATRRNSILQDWGYEKDSSAVQSWVGRNAFPPEGLGMTHEEWMKSKEEYQKMKLHDS